MREDTAGTVPWDRSRIGSPISSRADPWIPYAEGGGPSVFSVPRGAGGAAGTGWRAARGGEGRQGADIRPRRRGSPASGMGETGREETMDGAEIRVVVFRDGDMWAGRCLEQDIGAQADSPERRDGHLATAATRLKAANATARLSQARPRRPNASASSGRGRPETSRHGALLLTGTSPRSSAHRHMARPFGGHIASEGGPEHEPVLDDRPGKRRLPVEDGRVESRSPLVPTHRAALAAPSGAVRTAAPTERVQEPAPHSRRKEG